MSHPQHLPAETSSDEISLGDLARMLCAGWRLILAALVSTLFFAGIHLAATPKQYEATLIVRLGQIGTMTGVRQIEDSAEVVARVQSTEFQNAVVKSLGWGGDKRAQLLRSSYKFSNPSSRELKIRLRGFSSEEARKAADTSLGVLVEIHTGLSRRIVASRNRDFSKVQSDIAESEAYMRSMERLAQRGSQSGSEMAVAFSLKVTKDEKSRLRELYASQAALTEAMSPELNKPTMALEPTLAPNTPVHPNARRVWLFAALAGLMIGLLIVAVRSLNHMNRNTASSA